MSEKFEFNKPAPLFTIVEQVQQLNGKVPFVEEPRGGRIYKLDLPKANGVTVQAKLAEKAKQEDTKVQDTYAAALQYTRTCGCRFTYTELAKHLGVSFDTAKKLLQKLSMGRHVIKDGVMGTNGAKDAFRGKKA